ARRAICSCFPVSMANSPTLPQVETNSANARRQIALACTGPACRRHAGGWEDHESAPSRGNRDAASDRGDNVRLHYEQTARASRSYFVQKLARRLSRHEQQIHIGSFVRGKEGSNPVPSSGESVANLFEPEDVGLLPT